MEQTLTPNIQGQYSEKENTQQFPRISIVTPVFNQVSFLEETINSILSQGYPNLEYIIIDGGSTDGTVDIIRKYESHLAYWVSEPDKGMYDALQKGFDHSTGEIMGWLNADDIYHKGCLFQIANIFSYHSEINWLTGSHTQIDENGTVVYCSSCRKFNKYQYLTGDYMWIAQESTLWRRSLWEKAGSHIAVDMHAAGDFELWLRFIQHDVLFYVNTGIGIYRHREGQLSKDIVNYINEVNQIYQTLKIEDSAKKIIDTYKRKKRIANWINRSRIINGNKIVRLRTFEKKYLSVPQTLVWSDDIKGYMFNEEE